MSLTLVLPAYNEAERIGPALDELFGYLRRRAAEGRDGAPGSAALPAQIEVLVVDDGSTDGTVAIVEARPEAAGAIEGVRLHVRRVPHGGKGAAVRAGMLAATGDFAVFMDADMATPPDQIPLLLEALVDHDVALGSRIQPDGSDMRASQPGYRRLLGKAVPRARLHVGRWPGQGHAVRVQGRFGATRRRTCSPDRASRASSSTSSSSISLAAAATRMAIVPIRWYDKRGSRMRARLSLAMRVAWDLFRIPLDPSAHRAGRAGDQRLTAGSASAPVTRVATGR